MPNFNASLVTALKGKYTFFFRVFAFSFFHKQKKNLKSCTFLKIYFMVLH
jgi:hypothetical protein